MADSNDNPNDKRLVERQIRRGKLKRSELDKQLSSLEDTAQNAAVMDVEAMLEEVRQGRRRAAAK